MQPANGPMAIPGLIGTKQADIAIGNSLTVYWAYNGLVDFKERHRFVRVLQSGNDLLFGITTYKGTGIKSISDLKGRDLPITTRPVLFSRDWLSWRCKPTAFHPGMSPP